MRSVHERSHLSKKPGPSAPRQVRIIGGQWKRTPLPVLDLEGLRPTPDRVRETVFNWLEHLLQKPWSSVSCLDLFAGTGALGLEAASRGARAVTLIESQPAAVRQLEATREKLKADKVDVRRADAMRSVGSLPAAAFDVIFLDPPYQLALLPNLLPRCQHLLAPGGLLYAESDQSFLVDPAPESLAGWQVVRAGQAGQVHFALLTNMTGLLNRA
jgi:16S rRNA (guanine(966)-N(2))-methyltransferase RsmD